MEIMIGARKHVGLQRIGKFLEIKYNQYINFAF